MDAWRYRSRHWATGALLSWYSWAIRSRFEPMREVAKMVKRHLEALANAIYHGVTSARDEGMNSRSQWIKYTARAFRNRGRFRRAIHLHLGGNPWRFSPSCVERDRRHCSRQVLRRGGEVSLAVARAGYSAVRIGRARIARAC